MLSEKLARLSADRKRQLILRAAVDHIGDLYFWGGRSPYDGPGRPYVTGVDCSGLINLAYRTVGVAIPRDAHEQFLRARKITALKPADLVFLSAPNNPRKIVHVMLYAGNGWLIEGPGTGLTVRRITVAERLGRLLKYLKPGDRVNEQTLFFGAYLP